MAERDVMSVVRLREDLESLGLPPAEVEWHVLCMTVGQPAGTLEEYKRERQKTIARIVLTEVRMRGELGGD